MTDYTELVKALRHCVSDEKGVTKCAGCPYYPDITGCMDRLHTDAAAAIEALQAEVDKANKSADAYRAMYFTKHGDITIEKVRELDEIDCHFHSALIRLMYKRIEELESEENRQLPKLGKWITHPEVKNIYGGVYIECPFCGEKYVVQNVSDEKFCRNCGADLRAKMEVQE